MSLLLSVLLAVLLSTGVSAPAQAGPVWTIVVPFGAGAFTHGEPLRGAIYATSQVGFAGPATWSSLEMQDAALAGDVSTEIRHRFISAGGVAGFSIVWLVQIVDGSRLHAMEGDDALGLAPASILTQPTLNLAAGFSDPGAWPAYLPENSSMSFQP